MALRNVIESIIPGNLPVQTAYVIGKKMGKTLHMVMDPSPFARCCWTGLMNYPKSLVHKESFFVRPLGITVSFAEGAQVAVQRRAVAPAFSHRNMLNLSPIMTALQSVQRSD